MKVLVTGGAGFIGSFVVDQLVEAGHDVHVIDLLSSSAHTVKPDYLRSDVEYIWADVNDSVTVGRAVKGMEAVSHQAARVGHGLDFKDITGYVHDNDAGTAVLLRALYRAGFNGLLVLASSMVVYGEGGYTCTSHGRVRPAARKPADLEAGRFDPLCPSCESELSPKDLDEDAPLAPRGIYAATKVHQEHLCEAFAAQTDTVLRSLRYHNVYGPRMPRDTPYAGVASLFRSALSAGRAPSVYEDGRQRRDFIHVEDVARANLAALFATDACTGPFNIASGEIHTISEMAAALRSGMGESAPEAEITGRHRAADVRHVTASPERARRLLGFEATVPFNQGMAEFATAPLRAAGSEGAIRLQD